MLKIRCLANRAVSLPLLAAIVLAATARSSAAAGDKKIDAAARQRQLIAVLESAAAPAQKAIACKQLAIYGGGDAAAPLAKLLDDAELASWARIALEAIPDTAAAAALREARGRLHGKLLVGVINSIGVRRDAEAVAGLAESLRSDDAEVIEAAAVALGHIGTASALAQLEQSWADALPAVQAKMAEGVLLCADKLLAEGQLAAAAKVYDEVRQATVPRQRLLEATRGAILARQSAGVPLLVEQLQSTDKARFALGLGVARELPGKETTQALLAELQRAGPERQTLLLLALADRGAEAPLPTLLAAARNGPKHVRMVALRALGRQGDISCIGALLAAAVESDGQLAHTAAEALAVLPGNQVDADIAARLRDAKGNPRLPLIAAAGARRITAAVPALLAAAQDADEPTRCCALTALGQTVDLDNLPVLIAGVVQHGKPQESEAARAALSAACLRMPDREACAEKLASAMGSASSAAKCRLLEILGAMGGARALTAVAAAARDQNPELQDAACRVLGEWMTADASADLLALAKSMPSEKLKIRALRGYLRLARQLNLPPERRMAMYREALALAKRDEEKRLAVDVLQRIPTRDSLALAVGHLRDPAVSEAAGAVIVAIARKLAPAEPAAVADALERVVRTTKNKELAAKAKALLGSAAKR